MKALLFFNPKSRRHRPNDTKRIAELLAHSGIETETLESPPPSTNIEQYSRLLPAGKLPLCIIYGGDGTINDVINFVLTARPAERPTLGLLAAGTANVLARELGIPRHLQKAARIVAAGKKKSIYLGLAGRRYFVLMAGIGLDGYVLERVPERLKRRLGVLSFWIGGLASFYRYQIPHFQVEVDRRLYRATFAVVGNARTYGGILFVTPKARLDEPVLDVCIFTGERKVRFLRYLLAAFRGKHLQLPDVVYCKTDRIRATGDRRVAVQVDGDLVGHLPMEFEVSRHTVDVIVP